MLSYIHFTHDERICLGELLKEGKSIRQIARELGRSPSTISREIKRNSSKNGYHHWRAQIMSICRRRAHERKSLQPGSLEYEYVLEKLGQYWSPEQISMRLRIDHPGMIVGVSTIYRYIRKGVFPNIKRKTHLRRRGKNRNLVHHNSNVIHPDRIIPEWEPAIKERLRFGDWEGDTVYGGIGKGLLVTLVDRRSRFLLAGKLDSRNAEQTRVAIETLLAGKVVHSISLDNGTEFSEFKDLERHVGAPVYFAEPHKPWQRGTNENTNDLLRFFFPKGYDFRSLTQAELEKVVELINNRPRKCLGWKSPKEFCVALA